MRRLRVSRPWRTMADKSLLSALVSAAHALGSFDKSMCDVDALLKGRDVNNFEAFGRLRDGFCKEATSRPNIREVVNNSEVIGDAYKACAYARSISQERSASFQYLWEWTNSKQVNADRGRRLVGKKTPRWRFVLRIGIC